MKIGRGNKYLPLCPPQLSHDLTWDRTPGRRGGKPATNRLSYVLSLTAVITKITDVTPCSVIHSYTPFWRNVLHLFYTLKMEAARYLLIIDQTTRCHCRKQYSHNGDFCNLYFSQNIIMGISLGRIRPTWRVNFQIFIENFSSGKPERKTPFGWPGHRWENHMKINLNEIRRVLPSGM
jgi:hypothetical protein